eukprot:6546297-Prymnesium_polylepis.2
MLAHLRHRAIATIEATLGGVTRLVTDTVVVHALEACGCEGDGFRHGRIRNLAVYLDSGQLRQKMRVPQSSQSVPRGHRAPTPAMATSGSVLPPKSSLLPPSPGGAGGGDGGGEGGGSVGGGEGG